MLHKKELYGTTHHGSTCKDTAKPNVLSIDESLIPHITHNTNRNFEIGKKCKILSLLLCPNKPPFYIMDMMDKKKCCISINNSAPKSKNEVSTNIKYSRYIHLMSNFSSIRFQTKKFYVHMFDIVDTPFIY